MSDEQYFRLMSIHDITYSSLFSDEVFENPKWKTYADIDYLGNTDSEGFHYLSDQFLIQSGKQLSDEAQVNSVTGSIVDNNRIMNSLSSDTSCMSGQLANVEDISESNRTSRISFNNPPVEMSLEISRQTRDERFVPRGPFQMKLILLMIMLLL